MLLPILRFEFGIFSQPIGHIQQEPINKSGVVSDVVGSIPKVGIFQAAQWGTELCRRRPTQEADLPDLAIATPHKSDARRVRIVGNRFHDRRVAFQFLPEFVQRIHGSSA